MKFWTIFRYELSYQISRPWPWLFLVVVVVLSFLMTRDGAASEVLYADFFLNSPFTIALTTVFGTLIWLVMAAAIAGDAAARDVATGMHPLTYTTPVSKVHYLGGRFLAALVLNALILLGVQWGILLGVYLPGVHPSIISPFQFAPFLTAYTYISLPNAFVATALQFALATRSGRAMAGYFGSFLLVFMGFFIAAMLLFKRSLGTLLDPIGIRFIVEDIAHLWTPIEKNTRLLELDGPLLANRLLWLGIGLMLVIVTYLSFSFRHRTSSTFLFRSLLPRWRKKRSLDASPPSSNIIRDITSTPISVPEGAQLFNFATHTHQTLLIAWESFKSIAINWAGIALLLIIPLLTIVIVLDQMGAMGTPIVPTTSRVVAELTGSMSDELSRWVIVPFLIVYFAGELVWRERDAGVSEITDAMPNSEWVPFLGKFLGLGLLLILFMAALTAAGILAQQIIGYHPENYWQEIELFLKVMFGLQLTEYLLFALLALVVHVVVNQKYVGHLIAIMVFVFIALLAGMLEIEHKLLIYGASPRWRHTEMLGFGLSIAPWLWFKLYWAAWALLLAVVARLLWARGRKESLILRMQSARHRLTRSTILIAGTSVALIFALGGFIFYNTNVLNNYVTIAESKDRQAEYEKSYGRYKGIPQPEMTETNLHLEIYPDQRAIEIRGSYTLLNNNKQEIDSIHVSTAVGSVETSELNFNRTASLVTDDKKHGYRIYALKKSLKPGETLLLNFEVQVERRGFSNSGIAPSLVKNGSYFTNEAWFPFVGYQRRRELINAADRRTHGLEPRPVIASLYEIEEKESTSRGGGIAFEAVIGTTKGQIAVAPGDLRRTWTEGNRSYFYYDTSAPIGSEWAFFSADYAVHEEKWENPDGSGQVVGVRIFHHPEHVAHLNRMSQNVLSSLDYYTKQFGFYPYNHISLVEHPGGSGTGGHADASIISHGQGFAYWIPNNRQNDLDFPYFVIAHEMAHQWTLPYALVEGLPFLSEGLATFSAMLVVKASRGEEHFRRLHYQLRDHYPLAPIRRGEPLLRALDPYLAYRRGPFAMYALSEYIGSDQVNGAIRRLIKNHDAPNAPLATTLHLYHELQAVTPDSLNYLLHDLFEVNTYWDLKTERATAKQTAAGTWQVSLEVQARKTVYDSAGVVTEPPMDEWIQIGVYANAEQGDALSEPLHVQMHRIRSGKQTIKVTVPRKPARAGIDPYRLLDWEQGLGDNIQEVEID